MTRTNFDHNWKFQRPQAAQMFPYAPVAGAGNRFLGWGSNAVMTRD